MKEGQILIHRYYPEISIELVARTNRGWRVNETTTYPGRRKKPRTAVKYYDKLTITTMFQAA